jgi:hypothetical protein
MESSFITYLNHRRLATVGIQKIIEMRTVDLMLQRISWDKTMHKFLLQYFVFITITFNKVLHSNISI